MQEVKQEKSLIKQNILLYLNKKGVSPYEFYRVSGVTRGVLSQNNGISEDNLVRFLAYASDVNPSWLLTGKGQMLVSGREFLNDQRYIASYNRIFNDTMPLTDLTIQELAKFCKINPERMENIYHREIKMEDYDKERIATALGLYLPWVENGVGNQFIKPMDKDKIRKRYNEYIEANLPAINQDCQGSPYYNVDFIGGFDALMNDQTINPDFYINYPPYNKEGVVWVNLTGRSMEPELSQGDIIALKPVTTPIEYLPFGEIYAIVTDEYRTVKRIRLSERPGYIWLIPSNTAPEYQEQEIPINMITKVYAVLGSIRKFF